MTQDAALTILKTGANVFLTGEPGSGKTHTVGQFIAHLRTHGIEPSVTASTGIAATHVGGMTIHSWSGIGIRRFLSEFDLESLLEKESLVKRVRKAQVLIIDEISMLDGRTLDMVDAVCRTIRGNALSFGGLQVVFVGDFFQLPPVVKTGEPAALFAYESAAWKDAAPLVCYLTEQHRQDDAELIDILRAIRQGAVSALHMARIEERVAVSWDDDLPTKLYAHNSDVDRLNDEELARLPGAVVEYRMTSQGKDSAVEALKRGCLSPELLRLKKGARVMFTKNAFDVGYVNGTLGTVIGFDAKTGAPIIEKKTGGRVTPQPAEWAIEDNGRVLARISQLPLRLAWTMTIHKSQGMSLDAASIDLSRVFESGQGYVALSRVRTLAGLSLVGLSARAFHVDPKVRRDDAVFRTASDVAEASFADLGSDECTRMEHAAITAMGGTVEERTPALGRGVHKNRLAESTFAQTRHLLDAGKTPKEIAEERGLTLATIVGHIERSVRDGADATAWHLADDIPSARKERLVAAIQALAAQGSWTLSALSEHVPDASFEEMRLARACVAGVPPLAPKKEESAEGAESRPAARVGVGAKWTQEEEARLREGFLAGKKVAELARLHDRNPGGIRARLIRLGLLASPEGHPGFTLIELLVVIAIIAILSTVALSSYSSVRTRAKTSKVAAELSTVMKAAALAQAETGTPLSAITGNACSDCICRDKDIRNIPSTDQCAVQWAAALSAIGAAGGGSFQNLDRFQRDPWGSPYLLDENEREAGPTDCRQDAFRSAGPDGLIGTSDDIQYLGSYSRPCP